MARTSLDFRVRRSNGSLGPRPRRLDGGDPLKWLADLNQQDEEFRAWAADHPDEAEAEGRLTIIAGQPNGPSTA